MMKLMREMMFRFMPNCEESRELFWEKLETKLSDDQENGIRKHLLVCRNCRTYVEKLNFVNDEFQTAGGTQLSRKFKMTLPTAKRIRESIKATKVDV